MAKLNWQGKRKRRVREHVIAEMSVNFLERQVLRRSHQLLRSAQFEYGIDAYMLHFEANGELEDGLVYFQLKATDSPKKIDNGAAIAVTVETAHLRDWYYVRHHPVILILYDAIGDRAYWLDVQAYVDERRLDPRSDSVTLRVPTKNKLTIRAIDRFRNLSLKRMT